MIVLYHILNLFFILKHFCKEMRLYRRQFQVTKVGCEEIIETNQINVINKFYLNVIMP